MSDERINNYYTATLNDRRQYAPLDGDDQADIAIVGGGLTGVATALELAERGKSVILLESNRLGWGASGRNGGQVTGSLSGDEAMFRQLQRQEGSDAVNFIRHLRWHGHDIIKQRVAKYAIECDLKFGHLYTAWSKQDVPNLKRILDDACDAGLENEVRWLDTDEVHERLATPLYHGGILNNRNMHLHSLNLCVGEARAADSLGVRIHEHTSVTDIQPGNQVRVKTSSGTVSAGAVVLAGNAYHRLMSKKLGGKLFPAVLGNMTTAPLGDALAARINRDDLAVYDSRMILDYYRLTADKRLMFGGGTNYSNRSIKDVAGALEPALYRTFPELKEVPIDYAWTGTAGIVINRIPMIGKAATNVYYAQGYSGHGIATSHIVAEIMADALNGTMDHFDTFKSFEHIRLPVGKTMGNGLLALGMLWYRLKEKLN